MENFTCTGITYDQTDNCFWICDYGALNPEEFTYPKLVSIDTSITKKICEIDLSSCIGEGMHNIQGICFDKKTNCFYIADGNNIIVIDKTPILINQIDVSRYGIVANGICITEDDTLFVLGYNSFLLHLKKNGTLLEKKQFDFPNQDMLTIYNNYLYATVGADYEGDNNYLYKIDSNFDVKDKKKIQKSYAVEGLFFYNKSLYVLNDGQYHSAKINKSYIAVYDFQQ